MNITGTIRIYKSNFEGREFYSTTVSKKDQFGNYENLYINVQLPQGTSLENNSKINVTKGFLSFYKTKEGLPKIKAVVQEFVAETDTQETTVKPTPTLAQPPVKPKSYEQQTMEYYDSQVNYYGDDLPF